MIQVYYRGVDKKLHNYNVDVNCHIMAKYDVMAELHKTGEKFILPVLCLIQGGKQ